jgi:molybdate transport system substrate-binding protein
VKRYMAQLSSVLLFILALTTTGAKAAEKVTVFAAASLANAVDEIVTEYKKEHNSDIVTSYTSSSTLARQIEQGAPADIFISADQRWMNYLADKKLIISDSRVNLLANKLVVIAPVDSKLSHLTIDKNTDWLALLAGGRLSVGDPDHVPAGLYAKQAFEHLGQWDKILPTLARMDNVRSALLLVERGEAPLGVVYGSDAVVSNKVKVLGEFPVGSHDPVEYPLAMIVNHKNDEVTAFYQYLQSAKAKEIFIKYGFAPF